MTLNCPTLGTAILMAYPLKQGQLLKTEVRE